MSEPREKPKNLREILVGKKPLILLLGTAKMSPLTATIGGGLTGLLVVGVEQLSGTDLHHLYRTAIETGILLGIISTFIPYADHVITEISGKPLVPSVHNLIEGYARNYV